MSQENMGGGGAEKAEPTSWNERVMFTYFLIKWGIQD